MPWDYILGSAGGAGIILVLMMLFFRKYVEGVVDQHFRIKLEELKGDLSRKLAQEQSELEVWGQIRKDILAEMWAAHREIVKNMTAVLLEAQKWQDDQGPKTPLSKKIDEYRSLVHNLIDLISPEAVSICDSFLATAYHLVEGAEIGEGLQRFKEIRRQFYEYTAKFFGTEKMMPWFVKA